MNEKMTTLEAKEVVMAHPMVAPKLLKELEASPSNFKSTAFALLTVDAAKAAGAAEVFATLKGALPASAEKILAAPLLGVWLENQDRRSGSKTKFTLVEGVFIAVDTDATGRELSRRLAHQGELRPFQFTSIASVVAVWGKLGSFLATWEAAWASPDQPKRLVTPAAVAPTPLFKGK